MRKFENLGSAEAAGPSQPAGKLRILCAEDCSDLRECLVETLSQAGYEVTAVENGQHAWEEMQSCEYDLLVTDHETPRLSGAELALRVRTEGMSLPIIVITGCGSFYTQARRRILDISEVLEKPFALSELTDIVGTILCSRNQIGRWRDEPGAGFTLEAACGPVFGTIPDPSPAGRGTVSVSAPGGQEPGAASTADLCFTTE